MTKEFKKSFAHPTRRRLMDMVNTGEYAAPTQVSFSDTPEDIHEVGDTWTDSDGSKWEQKEFGRMKTSAMSDTMSEVRDYLKSLTTCKSPNCTTIKYGPTDKKLISKTGYCSTCLAKLEFPIKMDGMWEAYETYRINSNMIDHATDILANLKQAHSDVKQEYEYVNNDGRRETWTMERPAEELKAEIMSDILNIETELDELVKTRDTAWDQLKDKNYELCRPQ